MATKLLHDQLLVYRHGEKIEKLFREAAKVSTVYIVASLYALLIDNNFFVLRALKFGWSTLGRSQNYNF